MQVKMLNESDGRRTYAVVFDKDEEFISGLKSFAKDHHLAGSHFTGIGAFSSVSLRFFDRRKMEYKDIPVDEQVEVLSLVGNITRSSEVTKDGLQPKVHAHVVVGRSDATTLGGHIREARVWPTLEVVIVEELRYLQRAEDEETGLALIEIRESETEGQRS